MKPIIRPSIGYKTCSCYHLEAVEQFIAELAKLYDAFATELCESFAIKAAMTMPALLLQKPHLKSKSHDHISCLNRRLALWEIGNIAELLKEGKLIQSHLRPSFGSRPNEDNESLPALSQS